MATIAELIVKIGGNSDGLQKEIRATERQLKKAFGPQAMEMSSAAATAIAGIGVAIAAAGVAAVGFAGKWALAVNAIEDVTGMSGESASRLMAVGQMVGLSGDEMSAALVKMSKSAQTAKESIDKFGSESDDAYTKFGIAIVDSNGKLLSGEQIFANVLARHREMDNGVEKTAMELEIFGKSGAKLNDLLNLTDAQMSQLTTTADRMGLTIGSEQSQAWETMTFEINKGKLALTALATTMTSALLPSLSSAASGLATFMAQFAVVANEQGITTALRNLIPPELQIAIFAIGGALTAVAVPSMLLAAKAAIALAVALGPTILIGAALGAVAYVIWAAWEPLSELFMGVWTDISNWCSQKWDDIKNAVMGGIDYIYSISAPIVDFFIAAWGVIANGIKAAWDWIKGIVMDGVNYILDLIRPITNFVGKVWDKVAEKSKSVKDSVVDVGDALARVTTAAGKTGTALGEGSKAAGKAADDIVKKAKEVSEAIDRIWVSTTKTELQQLDIWKAENIKKLDEVGNANGTYAADRLKIDAVYSARRIKIEQDEAAKKIAIMTSVRDMASGLKYNTNGMAGNDAELMKLAGAHEAATSAIGDKWDQLATRYKTASAVEKAELLKNLAERKIAYEDLGNGEISFTANKNSEMKKLDQQYNQDLINRKTACKDILANIDAAFAANSMAKLQETLTAANAIRLNDYTAQQLMMTTFQQAFLQAHQTTAMLMAGMYSTALSGLETAFTGLFSLQKTLGESILAFGQTMLNSIAQYYAKQLAGIIMVSLFGKQEDAATIARYGAKTAAALAYTAKISAASKASIAAITLATTAATATITAISVASGAAIAAAWAPAAAMVSLATMGGNAAPAMAGITATTAVAQMASMPPKLANGGIATGPSLAVIGEGRYKEAVLPLSDRVFAKMADGINKHGGGETIVTQNVYGDINTEADCNSLFRALGDEIANAMMGA